MKITSKELEKKIKKLQDYLGPKVNYTSDHIPEDIVNRWLLEYLSELKHEHYKRQKRRKRK